jgi:hypothetical protein
MNILTVNLLFSTLVFRMAARIYVLPRLHELKPRTILLPILVPHSFRHLGLMFLAPGPLRRRLPIRQPSAICLPLYWQSQRFQRWRGRYEAARFLVWLFNVEGTIASSLEWTRRRSV